MNKEQLIAKFRVEADDAVEPYLWTDEQVLLALDEAQEEAAIRARLIVDNFTLTFDTDTGKVTNCTILDPLGDPFEHDVLKPIIARWAYSDESRALVQLKICSHDYLVQETQYSYMRAAHDDPQFLAIEEKYMVVYPVPISQDKVSLEAYRTPAEWELMSGDADKPAIAERHHRKLVDWALYMFFMNPDANVYDAERASHYLERFESYFGMRWKARTATEGSTKRGTRKKIY